MKKYINIAFLYAIVAMVGGVFYREFTKFNDFTGVTALGKVHTHFFLLGMVVFLLVALFSALGDLEKIKSFRLFARFYHPGLILMGIMLVVRGVAQVLGLELSSGLDAAISGVAGIGHILLGIGIVLLLNSLKTLAAQREG